MGKLPIVGLLGEVSGQVGDIVFTKIRKKRVVKQKGVKQNNHTPGKQRTENLFKSLPKVWSEMKRSERRTWEELVKCGSVFRGAKGKIIDDGMVLFLSFNRNLQEADEPYVKIAPSFPVFPPSLLDTKIEIQLEETEIDIKFYNNIQIDKDIKVILYATPILTSGKLEINQRLYRKIGVIDSNFKKGDSICELYFDVFNEVPEEGDEISFIFKSVNRNLGTVSPVLSQVVAAKRLINNQKES